MAPAFQAEFWALVNKGPGCWLWQGSQHRGYGRVRVGTGRAHYRAHRIAYYIATGDDPGEMLVCHRCDNPQCVRPEHLFLGTTQDNTADMVAKGRHRPPAGRQGASNPNAVMGEAEARVVIGLLMKGMTNTAIAKRCAVGHAMVSRIRVGRAWREVADAMGYEPKPSRLAPKSGRTAAKTW